IKTVLLNERFLFYFLKSMEYVIYKLLIYKESEDNLNLVLKKTILHCKEVFNYIKKLASVLLDEIKLQC
ncbi:MAG: hypothetical protein L0J97_01815, partial [Lactococcus lactis]|nr:hypothetical protein [Lactococcus lactis]